MPGRTVGSIEVVVDANTGKLRAQIVPALHSIGKEGADALDSGLATADAKELKAKL
jgi:hypothetical protein